MGIYKTPLRYPGGKQKLTPFIQELLVSNEITGHYVEPYAGGAGVAMELLLTKKVQQVHLNDSNVGIYAFWYCVKNMPEELCRKIASASLTVEEWKLRREIVRSNDRTNFLELGFSIFYLNRCNRSGVLSAGLIGGLDQTGNYKMDARFTRNDLIRRIEAIALFRDRITLTNLDAETYIREQLPQMPLDSLVYLDPPYYEKSSDLYMSSYLKKDHERLARIIQKGITRKWVLSYDGVPEILNLYRKRRHFLYDLQYSAGRSYKGKEVFVFSDKLKLPTQCSIKGIDFALKSLL